MKQSFSATTVAATAIAVVVLATRTTTTTTNAFTLTPTSSSSSSSSWNIQKKKQNHQSFNVQPLFTVVAAPDAVTTPAAAAVADYSNLQSILRKPSKTLAVVVDVDMDLSSSVSLTIGDVGSRSMQLRQLKASAIATRHIDVARELLHEQAQAKGNFPGPAPVIYTGTEIAAAVEAGVAAVVVSAEDEEDDVTVLPNDMPRFYKIESVEQVTSLLSKEKAEAVAFVVSDKCEIIPEILAALPGHSIVLLSVTAMQPDTAEVAFVKQQQAAAAAVAGGTAAAARISCVLLQSAIVGDNEDLEYAEFVISALTKKQSSTFNMSGLTGKANGHFGGVASNKRPKTWLRPTRTATKQEQQ